MLDPIFQESLIEAGLWPACQVEPPAALADSAGDLLPGLTAAWAAAARVRGAGGRSLAVRAEALSRAQTRGARLTWGVPGLDRVQTAEWFGCRLAWWPGGMPSQRRIGFVSSRLGQDLDRRTSWFAVLRTACVQLDPRRDVLITAGRTAAQRFVRRCGQLFALPTLDIEVGREGRDDNWQTWGRRVVESLERLPTTPDRVLLSPPIRAAGVPQERSELRELPVADRALCALSQRLLALHVRPHGNVRRLLQARLHLPGPATGNLFLALGPELIERTLGEELLDAGAVGWLVMNAAGEPDLRPSPVWPDPPAAEDRFAPIIACPTRMPWPFLTHCTRRRAGPWPGQNEDQYLDDLILDRAGADHSALAALWRIVRTERLMASSQFVRGSTRVISWTAVPLHELQRLRTYRSHLGRWDFEPYGICIRREWLARRGTRPVRYGDAALWASLPPAERPFFQKHVSTTDSGRQIDWTVEQEWRHVGDLRLEGISADDALLFVASEADAQRLAAASPWPIVVLERPRRSASRPDDGLE